MYPAGGGSSHQVCPTPGWPFPADRNVDRSAAEEGQAAMGQETMPYMSPLLLSRVVRFSVLPVGIPFQATCYEVICVADFPACRDHLEACPPI